MKGLLFAQKPAEALEVFKANLQKADPNALEEGVKLFGRNNAIPNRGDYMLQAFRMLLESGYSAPFDMWKKLHQITPISAEVLYDLAKDANAPWIRDEDALIAMMQIYGADGNVPAVEAIFERFRQALTEDGRHIQPSPRAWETMIAAAGATGDISAAQKWFDAWRRSPAHPYGHMEALQEQIKAYKKANGRQRKMRKVGHLLSPVAAALAIPGPSLDFIRAAHLVRPSETPEPGPYIALLKAYSENTRLGNKTALTFIRFMAAERVATNVRLVNGLMHYELSRGEKGMTVSVLGLYACLQRKFAELESRETVIDAAESMRPNSTTFLYAFRAYRERPQRKSHHDQTPLPTLLARDGSIPSPPDDLLQGPRRLFLDFLSCLSAEVRPSTPLLNDALKAFVDRRDFAGAAIVLKTFPVLRVEPCARTHAIVVRGVLRAAEFGEAFVTASARSWLDPERVASLLKRIDNLNELAGYTLFGEASADIDVHVMDIEASAGPDPSYTITYRKPEKESPQNWNGCLEPRTEEELGEVRRYEYGYLDYLLHLLERAGENDHVARSWRSEIREALRDMVPTALQNAVSLPNIPSQITAQTQL
jgi:hypothetical protein